MIIIIIIIKREGTESSSDLPIWEGKQNLVSSSRGGNTETELVMLISVALSIK